MIFIGVFIHSLKNEYLYGKYIKRVTGKRVLIIITNNSIVTNNICTHLETIRSSKMK